MSELAISVLPSPAAAGQPCECGLSGTPARLHPDASRDVTRYARALRRETHPRLGTVRTAGPRPRPDSAAGVTHVSLLGPVRVLTAEESVAVGGVRQRTLLSLLCVTAGDGGIALGRLAEEIWGMSPPARAETTLRSYVTRLRRILDRDPHVRSVIEGRHDRYRLDISRVSLDLSLFGDAIGLARTLAGPARAEERARALRSALALWRGPAFADATQGPLLLMEAARWDKLRLSAAEEMAKAELDCGRHTEVIPELEQLVAGQPWHEGLWSLLVLALYRAGRQAEALRALQSFRDRLRTEAGLVPSRELSALGHSILVQDSALDWTPPPGWRSGRTAGDTTCGPEPRGTAGHARRALRDGLASLARQCWQEAAAHFSRGLAALGAPVSAGHPPPAGEQRLACDLLLGQAEALAMSRDLAEARAAALAAGDLARTLRSARSLAIAAVWGTYVNAVGRPDPALATLCTEALEHLGDCDPGLRARVLAGLAGYQGSGAGMGGQALVTSAEALRVAQDSGDPVAIGRCLFVHAEALGWTEKATERMLFADQLLRHARRFGNARCEAGALRARALVRLVLSDVAGFDRDRARLARLVRGSRYRHPGVFLPLWEAMRRLMTGELAAVEPLVNELLGQAAEDPDVQNLAWGQLLFLRREQGRLGELRPVLGQLAASEPGVPAFTAALALAWAEAGAAERAAGIAGPLAADGLPGIPRDLTWTTTLCLLAEVASCLADAGTAGVLLPHLLPYRGQLIVMPMGLACAGAADRYLAMLHAAAGNAASARECFESALRTEARLGAPALLARTQLCYGRFLLGARDREHGAQVLGQAAVTAEARGLPALAGQARALLHG